MRRLMIILAGILSVCFLYAGELDPNETEYIYGNITPDATSGWVEINLVEKKMISGIEVYGTSTPDQELWIDILTGDTWVSYSGYRQGMVEGQGYYYRFTAPFHTTDRIKIRVKGPQLDGFEITDIKLFGHSVAGMSSPAEIKTLTCSDNTDMYYFIDNVIDGNVETEWRITNKYYLTSVEKRAFYFIKNPVFADRLFPYTTMNTGEAIFELNKVSEIDFVHIYVNEGLDGDIFVYTGDETAWTEAGILDRNAAPGWHKIPVTPGVNITEKVKISFAGDSSDVGGIMEVEIWQRGFDSSYEQLSDNIKVVDGEAGVFFFTSNKKQEYTLELDVCGNNQEPPDININGNTKTNQNYEEINNINRYTYTIAKQDVRIGDNLISVLPVFQAMEILGVRLRKKDTHHTEYGQMDNSVDENIITLEQEDYVNHIYLESPAPLIMYAVHDSVLTELFGTSINNNIIYYPVNRLVDEIKILSSTGVETGIVIINKCRDSRGVIDIEALYPDVTSIPDWLVGATSYYFTARLTEELSQVMFEGQECSVVGNVFFFPMYWVGLGTGGGYRTLEFDVSGAGGNSYTKEIEILVEWQYVYFEVFPQEEVIYTQDDFLLVSGSYSAVSHQVHIWNNDIEIPDITVFSSGRDFECSVPLEQGYNGITLCVISSDGNVYRTITKKVFKYSNDTVLSIIYPEDGQVVNSSPIVVQGRVNPAPGLVVEVNNTPAMLNGNKYVSGPVDLIEGINGITVQAKIGETIVAEEIVTLTLDSVAPVIQVNEPSPDSIFNNKKVFVSVSVQDEGQVWVNMNNLPIELTGDIYETLLTLEEGINSVTVTVLDYAGNRSEFVIDNLMVDITPPEPFILTIDPAGWTNSESISITCSTTDALSGINRYEMSIDSGEYTAFSSPVTLTEDGEHSVTVRAFDNAGNTREAAEIIYIDRTAPSVPESFRAVSGNDSIHIKWKKTDKDVVKYILLRFPEWPDSSTILEFPGTGNVDEEYIDTQGITGETAYIYSLFAVDRANNISDPVISDVKIEGVEIVDVSEVQEEDLVLVEYEDTAVVIPATGFPDEYVFKKIVCTEIEKQAGRDNDNDGIIDEYVDSPYVERAKNPIVGHIYDYSVVVVDDSGEEKLLPHITYDEPLVGRFSYDELDVPAWANEENLDVYYFNDIWCSWIKVEDAYVDSENNQIIFSTNHFSSFSVQPTIIEDLSPEDLSESGYSPLDSVITHTGVNITPEGGGVHTESTEFYLPGKNGFDFILKRVYDSSLARNDSSGLSIAASMGVNFFNPVPEDVPENAEELGSSLKGIGELVDDLLDPSKFLDSIGDAALGDLQSRFENVLKSQGDYAYSMGQGWRLNLPYIRSSNGGVLVRLPNGAFYDITEMDVIEKNDQFLIRELDLENHNVQDFTFKVKQGRINTELSDILKTAFDCDNLIDAVDNLETCINNHQIVSNSLDSLTALYGTSPDCDVFIQHLEASLLESNIATAGSINSLIRRIANAIPDWNVLQAELQLKDGTTYLFNEKGMLDKINDPTGNHHITATYDTGGGINAYGWKLISLEDSMGRKLNFNYEDRYVFLGVQKPYITGIELENDPYARRVEYTIDDAGLKTSGDNITKAFLGFSIFDMPVFPASLLSKAEITAKKNITSSEEINKLYCYEYDPEYLFNYGGSAKLNILSIAADAISMLLCGMPAFSMVTGMDNLTLSADVRFDFVLPMAEINGPGIGRIVVDNKVQGINYAFLQFTDRLFDLIPVSVEGNLRHTDRLVADKIVKYKDKASGTPENTTTYTYFFDTTQKGNVYNTKTIVDNEKIKTEFTYSAFDYTGDRLISWSDDVVENLQSGCLIAPINNIRTYGNEVITYDSNTENEIERIVFSEYNEDYTRVLKQREVRSGNHYTETTFDYDNWGNIIHTKEVSQSGKRENQLESFHYYLNPESVTQGWGSNAVYTSIADVVTLGNPYQSDHNNLVLEREEERDGETEVVPFKRYDLLLGTVTRNYSSVDDIPSGYLPPGINPGEYTDSITYNNYDILGRIKGKADYSETAGRWIYGEYTYDPLEGYINTISTDFDVIDGQVKRREVSIIKDYSDSDYYTVTETMFVKTPGGENSQTITIQTGLAKATGKPVWKMDGRGYYTTYIYDGLGRIVKTEKPDDSDLTYNPLDEGLDRDDNPEMVIEYSDALWTANNNYYTGFENRVQKNIDPGRTSETIFSYNNLGQLSTVTTKNHEYGYINDGDGTKSLSTPGQEITSSISLEYTGYGEVNQMIQPYTENSTRSLSYEYDPLGRVKKITDDNFSWDLNRDVVNRKYIDIDYDYNTNTMTTTDQLGNNIIVYYDMNGRVIKKSLEPETVYTKGVVSYVPVDTYVYYDGLGNTMVSIDGRGNAAYHEYDNLGRLIRSILPEGDSDHGFIEKENNDYQEVTSIFPSVEYDYTLSGVKKKEITGYVGMDETKKLVKEYHVDEMGRVFGIQHTFTPTVGEDQLSAANIHTTDWESFNWQAMTWEEGIDPVSVKFLVYYDENGNKVREVNPENTLLMESGQEYYSHDYEYTPRNKIAKDNVFVRRSGTTGAVLEQGDETKFWYNNTDNPVLMTDAQGHSIEYFYDELNRLILAVKPKHPSSTVHPYTWFEYEKNNKVKLREDGPEGYIHSYTYNAKGLVVTNEILETLATQAGKYTTTYLYDAGGNLAGIEDNLGNITEKFYDSLNREKLTIFPDQSCEWKGYDENGNKSYLAGGFNNIKERENWIYYDNYNRVIKTINAKGSNVESETTKWYDVFGNERMFRDAKDRTYFYDYDERGLVTREVNTRGKISYFGYDRNGNPIFHQDPGNTKVLNLFNYKDLLAGIVCQNDGKLQWLSYDYDTMGNIKTIETSENITTAYNYENGTYIPDPYGRVLSMDTSLNQERTFRVGNNFDSADRVTSFIYPDEVPVTYTYNRLGELSTMPGYLSDTIAPVYNDNGLLTEMTGINGVKVAYSYDSLSRVDGIHYTKETISLKNYSMNYDQFGNIREINGGQYIYDELNRLVNAHVKGNFEVDVVANDEQQRAGIVEGDILGEKVLSFSGEDVDILTLDHGAVSIGVALGGGENRKVSRIRLYPDTDLKEEQNLKKENLALFSGFINGDDKYSIIPAEDWILKQLDSGVLEIRFKNLIECRYIKVHAFCDDRDINNAIDPSRSVFSNTRTEIIRVYYVTDTRYESYTYDNAGNRVTSSYQLFGEELHEKTYRYYDDCDLLLWDGTYAYAWDANGNLTAKGTMPQIDGEDFLFIDGQVVFSEIEGEYWKYEYDLLHRLISLRKSEAGTNNLTDVAYYTYDGNNLRVKKEKLNQGNPEQATYFCFSAGGTLLFEETDTMYTKYIYIGNTVFAKETGSRHEEPGNVVYHLEKTWYYHTNHTGTTTMMTDETGDVHWQDEMTPFGESGGQIGLVEDIALYTGKELDTDSGLYYFNARWYNASIGMFVTEDPIKSGMNWYVYCSNNPLTFIDPSGLNDELSEAGMNRLHFLYGDDLSDEIIQAEIVREKYLAGESITVEDMKIYFIGISQRLELDMKKISELIEMDKEINAEIKRIEEELGMSYEKFLVGIGYTTDIQEIINKEIMSIIDSFIFGETPLAYINPETAAEKIYTNVLDDVITKGAGLADKGSVVSTARFFTILIAKKIGWAFYAIDTDENYKQALEYYSELWSSEDENRLRENQSSYYALKVLKEEYLNPGGKAYQLHMGHRKLNKTGPGGIYSRIPSSILLFGDIWNKEGITVNLNELHKWMILPAKPLEEYERFGYKKRSMGRELAHYMETYDAVKDL